MTLRNQFNGKCKRCGGFVAVGDLVEWVKGVKGVTHTVCPVQAGAGYSQTQAETAAAAASGPNPVGVRFIFSKWAGKCTRCGGYLPQGSRVAWVPGVKGVTHVEACKPVAAVPVAPAAFVPVPAPVLDMAPVVKLLKETRERALASGDGPKFPKLRVLGPDGGELLLSLAGEKAKVPGSVYVKLANVYLGAIGPDGSVRGNLAEIGSVLDILKVVGSDPAAAAKNYAAVTTHCSFCSKKLTDLGSIEVGYGPDCAEHWGLPHHPKGSVKLVPVLAEAA